MKWSIDRENLLTLSCDDSMLGPEDSFKSLQEFWKRVCREIINHYPDAAFKVVFCELWPDSGRIISYPSDRPPVKSKLVPPKTERICLQVFIPWLQSRFDKLPDPDTQTGAFEKASKALSKVVQQHLAEAVREPEIAQELANLRAKAPFRICIVDDGNLIELRHKTASGYHEMEGYKGAADKPPPRADCNSSSPSYLAVTGGFQ